jgi:AcrR family transcriptional regulator
MSTADDILDAAEAIHRKHGLAALSTRKVADVVGVTPMALYKHFADKGALLDALAGRGFAILERYLARALDRTTPLERITAGLTQFREFALAEPRYFELMYFAQRNQVPSAPESLRESSSPSFTAFIEAVREHFGSSVDPGELILLVWATAHGLIALHFSGRFGGDDARFRVLFDRAVSRQLALLDGMRGMGRA